MDTRLLKYVICRTPDVASMHQDTSPSLHAVAEKLDKALGISFQVQNNHLCLLIKECFHRTSCLRYALHAKFPFSVHDENVACSPCFICFFLTKMLIWSFLIIYKFWDSGNMCCFHISCVVFTCIWIRSLEGRHRLSPLFILHHILYQALPLPFI